MKLSQTIKLGVLGLIAASTLILTGCSETTENNNNIVNNNFLGTTQTYRVTFQGIWSSATHNPVPGNPHFSPLVVANHLQNNLWAAGVTASAGVEIVAETGATATLLSELNAKVSSGEIFGHASATAASGGTEAVTLTIQVNQAYPLLSILTMIAPSPDWIAARNNIRLYNNNQWTVSTTLDVFAYDAGTDAGTTFTAGNVDIPNHLPIIRFQGNSLTGDAASFVDGQGDPIRVGTVKIELVQ